MSYYENFIYIQTAHQGVRNKDILNVNTSSDFCIFTSPTFTMSGASKVVCNESKCTIGSQSYNDMLTAATDTCFTQQSLSSDCLELVHWKTKIYENNEVVYSADFHTSTSLTGNLPTDTQFTGSVITAFDTLEYDYSISGNTFTISKPYGVTNLQLDICIEFDLADDCVVTGLTGESGATCDCPSGYTSTYALDECESLTFTSSTTAATIVTAATGDTFSNFDVKGVVFLPNVMNYDWPLEFSGSTGITGSYSGTNFVVDASKTLVPAIVGGPGLSYYDKQQITNQLWGRGTSSSGRMNNAGIQSSPNLLNEWHGFSFCIDIETAGTYYVGMGADDSFRFKLNGDSVFEQINALGSNLPPYDIDYSLYIQHFWVFEVDLASGKNIFEVEYKDVGGLANLTFEVYSGTTVETLSAMTTESQLSGVTMFSTIDQVGENFQTGENSGYSCPTGYTLDTCSGTTDTCVKIEKVDIDCYSGFTGSCSGSCTNVCTEEFSAITTGNSAVHIISTATTQDITFNFTGNTSSFVDYNTKFKYEIYKLDRDLGIFHTPAILKSKGIEWSSFSGTSALTQTIDLSTLDIDGEYLVKGYYIHNVCTEFANRLGIINDTSTIKTGESFGLYEPSSDFYMSIFREAEKPIFDSEGTGTNISTLSQISVIPTNGQTQFVLPTNVSGDIIVTLNGLVLSNSYDFTVSQSTGTTNPIVVTLSGTTYTTDLVSFIYSTSGSGDALKTESIDVNSIPSGGTDGEGNNKIYFNTDTNKYEAFISLTPTRSDKILVMLNGVTLVNGIDFYQSISNPKRIIFEGTILVGDIITIVYAQNAAFVDQIYVPSPTIFWNIKTPPTLTNGKFILEFASNEDMNSQVSSAQTTYVVGQNTYSLDATISGTVGTNLYYRVTNIKEYETLCGDVIESIAYSEVVPITIATNSINSY